MTLHPALARLERGFRRMWGWAVAKVRGARPYRYDGEEEAHAEQLRETQIALGLMASADASDPDQLRMATEIEDGAEARLVVLLGKPRLSLAEKRERDDIQRRITERRQGFASHLEQRADGGWKPQGFAGLAAVSLVRPWMLWTAALAAVAMWGGYNDIRAGRAENQRDEAERAARSNAAAAESWRERANEYRLAVIDAAEVARLAAADLERERAARARAQQRERIRQREIQDVLSGSDDAPAWRLRDDPAPDDQSSPN